MTAVKQQQPDVVEEHFFSLHLINPKKPIKDETLQTLVENFKRDLDVSVADVVIQPTIMECKKCHYTK